MAIRDCTTAQDLTQALVDAGSGLLPAGSTIRLAPGRYLGTWILPVHPGSDPITITTTGTLPDRRILSTDLPALAVLESQTPGVPPIDTAPATHDWILQGLGLTQTGGQTYDLLRLGQGDNTQTTLAQQPSGITVDRCYLFVADNMEQRRGIGLNCATAVITRCTIENIKDNSSDSQAISGWNGAGPYTIDDCFLEAQSENIIFGGSDPATPNLVPADIVITDCTITKRLSWKGVRAVKNLIELKNARRVSILHNDLSNCWVSGQDGYGIVLTPRNQNNTAPWSSVDHVLIEFNRITNVSEGFTILGTDDTFPSQKMTDVTIRNNLVITNAAVMGGDGWFALIQKSPQNLTITNNTGLNEGTFLTLANPDGSDPAPGFVCTNNLVRFGLYGVIGPAGVGTPALTYFDTPVFTNNALAGIERTGYTPADFPPTTLFPTLAQFQAGFLDYAGGDYTVDPLGPFVGLGAILSPILVPPPDPPSSTFPVRVSTVGTVGVLIAGSLAWGDGSIDSWQGAPPATLAHTYLAPGIYTIKLSITDAQNRVATATLQVQEGS